MKLFRISALVFLVMMMSAQAQITNIWTLRLPAQFTATYFDNIDFTGSSITALHRSIDFDWNAFPYSGSPGEGIGPATFSARWTGSIAPFYGESYTFHTVS